MAGRFHRLAQDTLLALGACVVLAAAGAAVAFELLPAAAPALTGRGEVVMSEPSALARAQLALVAVFATPPAFAWGALFIWRLRQQTAPSRLRAAVCLTVPLAAMLAGFALQLRLVHDAFSDGGPQPLIAVSELFPASGGLSLEVKAAGVLWIVNALRRR